eukprot:gene10198-7145_t
MMKAVPSAWKKLDIELSVLRGLSVREAMAQCKLSIRKGHMAVFRALELAVQGAEGKGLDKERLRIIHITCMPGPTDKQVDIRSRGYYAWKTKKSSHLLLTLAEDSDMVLPDRSAVPYGSLMTLRKAGLVDETPSLASTDVPLTPRKEKKNTTIFFFTLPSSATHNQSNRKRNQQQKKLKKSSLFKDDLGEVVHLYAKLDRSIFWLLSWKRSHHPFIRPTPILSALLWASWVTVGWSAISADRRSSIGFSGPAEDPLGVYHIAHHTLLPLTRDDSRDLRMPQGLAGRQKWNCLIFRVTFFCLYDNPPGGEAGCGTVTHAAANVASVGGLRWWIRSLLLVYPCSGVQVASRMRVGANGSNSSQEVMSDRSGSLLGREYAEVTRKTFVECDMDGPSSYETINTLRTTLTVSIFIDSSTSLGAPVMSASRKRFRPLDLAEERSVTATDNFKVDVLDDEHSYCLSWPDTPLAITLGSGPSGPGETFKSSSAYSTVCLPKLITIYDDARNTWSRDMQHIIHSLRLHGPMRLAAVVETSAPRIRSEDDIFSLSSEQLADARRAGLFPVQVTSEDDRDVVQHQLEEEIVRLEWRAFKEAKHTAAALQRLLSLEAAVPFAASDGSNTQQTLFNDAWRRKVHQLWIRWRTRGQQRLGENAALRWGPPLIPGAYLYGTQQDYFLAPDEPSEGGIGRPAVAGGLSSRARPSHLRSACSFLSWNVERLVPQLCRTISDGAPYAPGAGPLQRESVEKVLLTVLKEPLSHVEVDSSHTTIRGVQLSDLQHDMETWSHWLGKVQ